MQRLFLHFGAALRRHRTLTLVLFVGLTLVCGVAALHSRVDNSLAVWQSADDPHWQQYRQFVARHRIIDPLILYLPGGDGRLLFHLVAASVILAQIAEQGRTQFMIEHQSRPLGTNDDLDLAVLFLRPDIDDLQTFAEAEPTANFRQVSYILDDQSWGD